MVNKDSAKINFNYPSSMIVSSNEYKKFNCIPDDFEENFQDSKTSYYSKYYSKINQNLYDAFGNPDRSSSTYVMYDSENFDIIGYYTIYMGTTKINSKFRKRYAIPGRGTNEGFPYVDVPFLAIDHKYQKEGYGELLLRHLLLNVYWQIIPIVGAELICLDAIDNIKGFYEGFGFIPYSQKQQQKFLVPLGLSCGVIGDILKIDDPDESENEKSIRFSLENTLLVFEGFK